MNNYTYIDKRDNNKEITVIQADNILLADKEFNKEYQEQYGKVEKNSYVGCSIEKI